MVEILPLEAENVIAIRMIGRIDAQDMDRIIEAAEPKLADGGKLRVYVEVDAFDGITFEALGKDMKWGLKHALDFKAKAVVSELRWAEKLAQVFDRLFPRIPLRHFQPDQKDEAWDWITGDLT